MEEHRLSHSVVPTGERTDVWKDMLSVATLIATVCLLFHKTILAGTSISKVCRIAEWDSLFGQWQSGHGGQMDPSLVQLMIPYYLIVAKAWHRLEIPLWNPFNACGCPLLADPQSTVLSPLHIALALSPTIFTYNLILIAEIILCAIGTFLLARECRTGRIAAVFAALTFSFCPYIQWYLELLGNGYCWYPILFWLFLRATRLPTWRNAVVAGIGCAFTILSGHPEVSFFGIVFASLLMVLSFLTEAKPAAKSRMLACARQLCVAGGTAFCLAAPMLLPFLEYLRHSDCYKFGLQAPECVPWQALLLNLLQPGLGGASLFLGMLPLMMLPAALRFNGTCSKRLPALLTVFVVSEACTAKLYPLGQCLDHSPLATLIVNYCQPIPLLMICILAAIGLDSYSMRSLGEYRTRAVAVIVTTLLLIVAPVWITKLVPLAAANFDMTLPTMQWAVRDWQRNCCFAVGIVSLLLCLHPLRHSRFYCLPLVCCLALNFGCEWLQAKSALPPQPHFSYPSTEPLQAISTHGGRVIGIGEHLLKPDTNVVYEISDVRSHNPLFPERYLKFIERAGSTRDNFNQLFLPPLSPLLNVAGASAIVSQGPVWFKSTSSNTDAAASIVVQDNLPSWPQLSVSSASYTVDAPNRQLIGSLRWKTHQDIGDYIYNIVVLTDQGMPIWSSEYKKVSDYVPIPFAACLPAGTNSENLLVGMQLFNLKRLQFIAPVGKKQTDFVGPCFWVHLPCTATCAEKQQSIVGAGNTALNAGSRIGSDATKVRLQYEGPNHIRIYDNPLASPEAYIADNVHVAKNGDDALRMIESPQFNCRREAVLEAQEIRKCPPRYHPTGSPGVVAILRKSLNRVELDADVERPSFLILTHTYYPGWNATVDGAETNIYHANYLFRAVHINTGHHTVVFEYCPLSWRIGILFCLACCLVLTLAVVRQSRLKYRR